MGHAQNLAKAFDSYLSHDKICTMLDFTTFCLGEVTPSHPFGKIFARGPLGGKIVVDFDAYVLG